MQCMRCKQRESVIQLHQIVNDEQVVVHLCQQCALDQGIEVETTFDSNPLSGFLSSLEQVSPETGKCPGCLATIDDYRITSRLGCPKCYTTFAGPLRDLLRRVHGATRHTGSRPPGRAGEMDRTSQLADLRAQLEVAVAQEQFERAAELRDQLRDLE